MNKKLKENFKEIKKWLSIRKNKFFLIGIFFLTLQLLIIWGNHTVQRYDVFYWFCNHTPLILAIAFFLNKRSIIKALINVGFLAQFLWTIDFVLRLLFGFYFLGVTRYVFEDINGILVLIPILIHVLSTNLALYFTYDKKPNIKIALYSLIYIILLYSLTLFYTLETRNVNCIYSICGATELTFQGYTYLWPILTFFLVAMPTQGIQYLLWKFSISKSKRI